MTKTDLLAAQQLLIDREPNEVPLTPIGKNFIFGLSDNTKRLLITDPVHEREKDILTFMYELGMKYYGKPEKVYSTLDKAPAVDF